MRLHEVTAGYARLLLKMALPILLTGIFFSFSRAAWIAAGILLVYWFISLLNQYRHSERSEESLADARAHIRVRSLASLGMTVFYIVLLVIIYRPLVFTRLRSDSRLEVKSRTERVEGLREAWQLIKKHSVLGVGIGNYTQGVARDLRPGQPLYTYQPVHNVFLLVWAELGTVGLLIFFGVLYFVVRISKPKALMILCFFVLMMADHFLWTLPFGTLLFWVVLGLSTRQKGLPLDKV